MLLSVVRASNKSKKNVKIIHTSSTLPKPPIPRVAMTMRSWRVIPWNSLSIVEGSPDEVSTLTLIERNNETGYMNYVNETFLNINLQKIIFETYSRKSFNKIEMMT